jgi:hypothetical protein
MDEDDIAIEPESEIGEGIYRLFSVLAQDTVSITAKGLLEVAAWVEAHKAVLEEQRAIDDLKPKS